MMRHLFFSAVLGVCLHSAVADVIFTDDFDDGEVISPSKSESGAIWTVDSGKFAADGADVGNYKPTSGELNFPPQERASIHVDFGPIQKDTTVTVKLALRQSNVSNASHRFDIILSNKKSGKAFVIAMAPNPEFFGTTGFAIFDAENNLLVGGLDGAHLKSDDQWQSLEVSVDNFGITLKQDEMLIAEWKDIRELDAPDRLTLTSTSGGVSWFVNDVEIDGTLDQDEIKKNATSMPMRR